MSSAIRIQNRRRNTMFVEIDGRRLDSAMFAAELDGPMLAKKAGVCSMTIFRMRKSAPVLMRTARAVARAMGVKVKDIATMQEVSAS